MAMRSGSVLILEDEANLLEVLVMHLGEAGYAVRGAADAAQALAALQGGGIGLAIIDVGAHGLTVARAAQSRNVPIILTSGRPVFFEIGGIGDILRKPFSLTDLLHRVEDSFRRISVA
jgi:two-component system KDP operon response regulator KdpE